MYNKHHTNAYKNLFIKCTSELAVAFSDLCVKKMDSVVSGGYEKVGGNEHEFSKLSSVAEKNHQEARDVFNEIHESAVPKKSI